jgi:hypothetical protein
VGVSVIVAVAYLFTLGPVAGLAPSLMASVVVALITAALRRDAKLRLLAPDDQ